MEGSTYVLPKQKRGERKAFGIASLGRRVLMHPRFGFSSSTKVEVRFGRDAGKLEKKNKRMLKFTLPTDLHTLLTRESVR